MNEEKKGRNEENGWGKEGRKKEIKKERKRERTREKKKERKKERKKEKKKERKKEKRKKETRPLKGGGDISKKLLFLLKEGGAVSVLAASMWIENTRTVNLTE